MQTYFAGFTLIGLSALYSILSMYSLFSFCYAVKTGMIWSPERHTNERVSLIEWVLRFHSIIFFAPSSLWKLYRSSLKVSKWTHSRIFPSKIDNKEFKVLRAVARYICLLHFHTLALRFEIYVIDCRYFSSMFYCLFDGGPGYWLYLRLVFCCEGFDMHCLVECSFESAYFVAV